ncbi:unnamed protein product [Schistocephalus solidus]|uniref:Fe2OG dioxygenase domain-containing protein n=1 Tax=Schistocephalus solidus TaxID=70667 RepID=A0A183SPS1_SCHSO|nr:unnamed protein product [Schistocephalus solidus]
MDGIERCGEVDKAGGRCRLPWSNLGRRLSEITGSHINAQLETQFGWIAFLSDTHPDISRECAHRGPLQQQLQEVYTLPLLTTACLRRLNAELDAFLASGLPASRPNTMNRQGILLCELPGHLARAHPETPSDPGGADVDLISQGLLSSVGPVSLRCLLQLIFPDIGGKIDSYRAFTVEYEGPAAVDLETTMDSGLSYHYDNAESGDRSFDSAVTMPVDEDAAGGEICFAHPDPHWIMEEPCPPAALVPNQPGWALFHRGSHVHGAQPLAPGYVRRNLIIWLRSTSNNSVLPTLPPSWDTDRPPICVCEGQGPQDLNDTTIVHLNKKKGNRQICDNRRGISLLSITGKIFTRILLNRLNAHLEQGLLPESKCGFERHQGTITTIFAARPLQEDCQEMRSHLYTSVVDLTKAFETVNRDCPERFTHMVHQLYDGIMARVTDNESVSEAFTVTNGVK